MDPAPTDGGRATGSARLRLLTVAAVVAGACWRYTYLFAVKWDLPLGLNDSLYYSVQARQLASGVFFREPFANHPGAEHGPLTSLLLAPVSFVDDAVPWQRLVTATCGVVTIVIVAILARTAAGPRAGAIAAWIAAMYPNMWLSDGVVLAESVNLLVTTFALLALLRAVQSPAPWRAAVAGAVFGLAALARSENLLALVLAAGVLMIVGERPRSWRHAGVALAAGCAVIAPWVAYNATRFEQPVLLTTNDGSTLLGSYCDDTFSGEQLGGWSLGCVTEHPDYRVDEEPSVRAERNRRIALSYARHHAGELPRVVLARIGRTLDVYRVPETVSADAGDERARWAAWAGVGSFWVLFPLAIVGFRRLDRRDAWCLSVPLVVVACTTVMFYGGHRFRSAMEPVVVICAAVAIAALVPAMTGALGRDINRSPSHPAPEPSAWARHEPIGEQDRAQTDRSGAT